MVVHTVSEYLEEQQQKQLNVLAATMDLLEGWGIPAVLLAALEADDFRVPTALQASVWSAGRGEYRADLLVHVRDVAWRGVARPLVLVEFLSLVEVMVDIDKLGILLWRVWS